MNSLDFQTKTPDELTAKELAFIHLNTSYNSIPLKESKTRSMLSFIIQGIEKTMAYDQTKNVVPIISLLCILDQLGICYNNLSKPNPKLGNGLKRAVYFFGDVDERDEVIKVLYALRNGLVHNISLASKNPNKPNDNYYFRYSDEITGIYQAAINSWTGNYSDLDTEEHVTLISPKNLKVFVDKCISTANSLNNEDKLEIRLEGGCQELFYCYLRTIDV